ncbi:MAG: hypothetical protein CVU86_03660 [Firmicutes bacterium HGW-Firmicutes-11]|jgi:cell division protein FtsQ|nr:MAG: hypothetical protein CVU86_03660 [Firmicutes bacterium HGW-Firmicutes-11]
MKQEIKKKRKKRKKKRYFLRFLLAVILCVGLYYFLSSEIFDIEDITVENNSYYTGQQIISMTGIGEVAQPWNLFMTSTRDMKERLLADPYIKTAKVSRRLPDGINIVVAERQEASAIPYGEGFILIDKEGIVLRQTDVEPALTILSGLTLSNIEPGTPLVVEENAVLNDTLQLLIAMEENELFFKRIEVSPVVIKAYIYDNLTCEGTPENILKSMDGLKEVLYDLYVQGIERGMIKVGGDGYYSFSPLVD